MTDKLVRAWCKRCKETKICLQIEYPFTKSVSCAYCGTEWTIDKIHGAVIYND